MAKRKKLDSEVDKELDDGLISVRAVIGFSSPDGVFGKGKVYRVNATVANKYRRVHYMVLSNE